MTPSQAKQLVPEAHYTHVGAQLRDLRVHYGLSVSQVSQRLHIRGHYIEAIEEGDLSGLPGKVYSQGYISSYAEFLGLNPQEVLEQYELSGQQANRQPLTVTEPTKQRGIPAWRWIVVVLLAMAIIYMLQRQFISPDEPEISFIEPVPSRLKEGADRALVLNESNRECLDTTAEKTVVPCYYSKQDKAPPLRSIMELK